MVNGNKPPLPPGSTIASAFTQRIVDHPRIAYYPHPGCGALVLFVVDELLVADDALASVMGTLGGIVSDTGATVFSESAVHPPTDVHILRIETPGTHPFPDVAEAVWQARAALPAGIHPSHVSPNHVLVPAPNYHTCPSGPPHLRVKEPEPLGPADGTVRVTVIDSGYVPGGPLGARAGHDYGYWLTPLPEDPLKYTWEKETPDLVGPDPLDQDGDGLLDALAGHANFVAGVVAQGCSTAAIEVVSHNAVFVWADDAPVPMPTEASVALSLWQALHATRPPNVVTVGFAFPTLPATRPAPVVDGFPSYTFSECLDAIPDRDIVIVAPAGNQNCVVPQYPAAFHTDPSYPNVVGVGSVDHHGGRSTFSNHGPWVACCTEGEDVVSTFVDAANMTPEEPQDDGTRPSFDFDGWASWSGTSFAAPKVAAAIAREVSATGGVATAGAAWKEMVATAPASGLGMGIRLSPLLP
jgi:thermitase